MNPHRRIRRRGSPFTPPATGPEPQRSTLEVFSGAGFICMRTPIGVLQLDPKGARWLACCLLAHYRKQGGADLPALTFMGGSDAQAAFAASLDGFAAIFGFATLGRFAHAAEAQRRTETALDAALMMAARMSGLWAAPVALTTG